MQLASGNQLILNGTLIDGTGAEPMPVECCSLRKARLFMPVPEACPENDAEKIDAKGGTIMPGLVEAHFHATYSTSPS